MRLFLCGDVMTGRGIDQIFPQSVDPVLYESYVRSARSYVALAERRCGVIPHRVDPTYVWGDALEILRQTAPAVRIINLETAVTTSDDRADKGINYRMHPANVDCLRAAAVNICTLANNHVLDWGRSGLLETLSVLRNAGIHTAGAGSNEKQASAPAVLSVAGRRVLVFAGGHPSSGIEADWAAQAAAPGINFLSDFSSRTLAAQAAQIKAQSRNGDLVVYSVHWGGNWGYTVPAEQQRFARGLIEQAGVDLVCGHSSHHSKGMEVYRDKLILYGCGDFINDYEGIAGHEEWRGDLRVMYFPELDDRGNLQRLTMRVLQAERFTLHCAKPDDVQWLAEQLTALSESAQIAVPRADDNSLVLNWYY